MYPNHTSKDQRQDTLDSGEGFCHKWNSAEEFFRNHYFALEPCRRLFVIGLCIYFRLLKHKVIRKFWRIERFFSEFLENKFFSRHAAPRHRRPFVFLTA